MTAPKYEKDSIENETLDQTLPKDEISRGRRWTIYIIGIIETFIFGGCIFGWAQLVFVLKNEGIFSDLCNNGSNPMNSTLLPIQEVNIRGCSEQDQVFALIYTITCVAYGTPAVLTGMLLHHYGLGVSRIIASLMLGFGFLALGCTTKENTSWIYLAMVLLAIGGNQIRLSGLQFCNLFPRYRSTALTVIGGSFAASAGLFLIFQIGQSYGLSLWTMSVCLACLAFLSLPATIIMPWHHIPHDEDSRVTNEYDPVAKGLPLHKSIFSVSNFTHTFWLFMNLTGVTYFAVSFNSWISEISTTNEEAGQYSLLYSVGSFFCPLFSPFPGMITDYLFRKAAKETSEEKRIEKELLSPVLPLTVVILISLLLQSCMFFTNQIAVYISLVTLTILRPSVIAVGFSFMRIRFPANHFDRMNGIGGTIISLLCFLQYPLFLWAQISYVTAMAFFTTAIGLTLIHPVHILIKSYRKKVTQTIIGEPVQGENLLPH